MFLAGSLILRPGPGVFCAKHPDSFRPIQRRAGGPLHPAARSHQKLSSCDRDRFTGVVLLSNWFFGSVHTETWTFQWTLFDLTNDVGVACLSYLILFGRSAWDSLTLSDLTCNSSWPWHFGCCLVPAPFSWPTGAGNHEPMPEDAWLGCNGKVGGNICMIGLSKRCEQAKRITVKRPSERLDWVASQRPKPPKKMQNQPQDSEGEAGVSRSLSLLQRQTKDANVTISRGACHQATISCGHPETAI